MKSDLGNLQVQVTYHNITNFLWSFIFPLWKNMFHVLFYLLQSRTIWNNMDLSAFLAFSISVTRGLIYASNKSCWKLKIMNQCNPRVSVSPTVEDIISLKVYNNDCSKIWKIWPTCVQVGQYIYILVHRNQNSKNWEMANKIAYSWNITAKNWSDL